MNPFSSRSRYQRTDIPLLLLTVLAWIAFFTLVRLDPQVSVLGVLMFALGSSALTYFVLYLVGYFNVMQVLPRKSDLLLLMVNMTLCGLLFHSVILATTQVSICRVSDILLWVPMISFFLFGMYYLWRWHRLEKAPRNITLNLLDEEADSIRSCFEELGYSPLIRYLDRQKLDEYLVLRREQEIDFVVISHCAAHVFEEDALLMRTHLKGVPVVDYHYMMSKLTGRINPQQTSLWTYMIHATPQTPLLRLFWRIKISSEPVVGLILGFMLAPLMGLIAALIWFENSGPILYRQVRTGYQGKNFILLKFRSMRTDSEEAGPRWASENDERVTPLGRFLRKYRLDELPQLWNVIRDDMSFFGPRPERPEMYTQLKESIPFFSLRTIVRPGITGWAQVCGGYAGSIEESRRKLEYDLFYIQNMSPRLDLIILFKTIAVCFRGQEGKAHLSSSARHAIRSPEFMRS